MIREVMASWTCLTILGPGRPNSMPCWRRTCARTSAISCACRISSLGIVFSSPSPIVLITVLYFSAIAIFQALVERFAFLDHANGLRVREERYMLLSLSVIFARLDGSFALLGRGHHRCHRQYRQSRIVPKSSRPSSFSFLVPAPLYHKLEYLILAV